MGNSLIGAGPGDSRYADHATDLAELRRLRMKLAAEGDGPDHQDTLEAIDEITGRVNATLNQDLAEHFRDVDTHRPFNWAVEFPEAFLDDEGRHRGEAAGFEVIIGNPPWEIIKPDLREFYAQFDDRIESKLTRRKVEARIAELNAEDPARQTAWEAQKAKIEEAAAYLRHSHDYPCQGRGDTATHKLFLERGYDLLERQGRLGFVIPSGIYSDLGTKELREMLLNKGQIQYLFNFSNERWFFPDIHHAFRFTLLGARKGAQSDGFWATFRFNPRVAVAPDELPTFLTDQTNLVYIRCNALTRFSPDSLSVMEFHSQRDVGIMGQIYADWPLIGDESAVWRIRFTREFDITNDRHLFNTGGRDLPLYEGKMIHQFDAFFGEPRYWLEESPARERLASKYRVEPDDLDYLKPRLSFRGIAAATNERTLMAAILPPRVFSEGRSATTVIQQDITITDQLFLAGCMNSFVLDWVLRSKVIANINMFYVYQLPLPRLTPGNPYFDAIVPRAARLTCTTPEFAGLWQEVMGEAWDESKGATDPVERQTLRDELDALVAHLYRLSRDDLAHILTTFPLVFPDDDAGEAKKEALLTVYDCFAEETKGWQRQ